MFRTSMPLFINTMGWNQGLGLCLLKDQIMLFKPSHVIQINHPVEDNKNMPPLNRAWLDTCEAWSMENKIKIKDQEVVAETSMQIDQDNTDLPTSNIVAYNRDITYKLITLKSNVPFKNQPKHLVQSKRYSAKDHRNIAIIAYFSNLQNPNIYFQPINQLRPYKVSWSKFALHCSHAKIEYNQLFRVFNASLIGLCCVKDKHVRFC